MMEKTSQFKVRSLLKQSFLSILYALAAFLFCFLLLFLGIYVWFAGRIFPGIYYEEIPLGGLSRQDARTVLQSQILIDQPQSIYFTYNNQSWESSVLELGFTFQTEEIIDQAFSVGRTGSPTLWSGDLVALLSDNKTISPVFQFEESSAAIVLNQIKQELDQPVLEAQLSILGNKVSTSPGQIGRELDLVASLDSLKSSFELGESSMIPLVVRETYPEIMDAESYALTAREFLSEPFSLITQVESGHTQQTYYITPEEFAPMLDLIRVKQDENTSIQLQFKESVLQNVLNELSNDLNISQENPRFIFNDETKQLDLYQNGIIGRSLNIQESMETIQTQVASGDHNANLSYTFIEPAVSNSASGAELGIKELIHQEKTFFYGSSKERIQNISTAADRFLGVLVAPGEVFSMADTLGEISLSTGFTEALIIYNGKTIEGVGGGVCQVSTTLFRTAFFAGFPIVERYPHAYRVSFYEKAAGNYRDNSLAGLDATVYVPLVDMKFQNDSPHWILMEAYVYPSSSQIVWKFYSTSDGRSVEWDTTGPINIIEAPDPKYYLNTSLDIGEIKQVDWEADGADVQVNRWVYQNGELLFDDQFFTHYEPWGAVFEIGPGVDGYPISEE